ncbi:unnamed protein product [Caretta caretta]
MVMVSPMVVQAIAHYSVPTARAIEMAQMEDKLPIWYGTQPTQLQNLMKMAESCNYGGVEPVGTGHRDIKHGAEDISGGIRCADGAPFGMCSEPNSSNG